MAGGHVRNSVRRWWAGRYVPAMDAPTFHDFAERYTAAWCSHDPEAVASFFAEEDDLAAAYAAVGAALVRALRGRA